MMVRLRFHKGQIVGHLKNMLNYVEDRRIDYYVFSTSLATKVIITCMTSISTQALQNEEQYFR